MNMKRCIRAAACLLLTLLAALPAPPTQAAAVTNAGRHRRLQRRAQAYAGDFLRIHLHGRKQRKVGSRAVSGGKPQPLHCRV